MTELSNRLSVVRDLLADATDMSNRDGNWVKTGEANDMAFQYDLDHVFQSDLNELVRLKLADKKGINFFRIRQAAAAGDTEGVKASPRGTQDGWDEPTDGRQTDGGKTPRGEEGGETGILAAGGGTTGAVASETVRQIL